MCLVLLSWKNHPKYSLIVASNRDEYFDRQTLPAKRWEDFPNVIGGRDLLRNGTWFGITDSGRWAAVTNYREQQTYENYSTSRGDLTKNYLTGTASPEEYASMIKKESRDFNGFNLLIGDRESIYFATNRALGEQTAMSTKLSPGCHGLSNGALNSDWPKVRDGTYKLAKIVRDNALISDGDLLKILRDKRRASVDELPKTGVNLEWEKTLSSKFISSEVYGTRASTLLLVERETHKTHFIETTFGLNSEETQRFEAIV